MHCINCGASVNEGAKFCKSCGKPIASMQSGSTGTVINSGKSFSGIIKCGNCGYIGIAEKARKLFFTILAWICVVFAPLITILYFVGTYKYRCPQCKSTFVGIQNEDGRFVGQRGGTGRVVIAIVSVLIGIAIMGIVASIILASLNIARQKNAGATSSIQDDGWQQYNSVADQFNALFPSYPNYDSQTDSNGNVPYTYHTYSAEKGTNTFDVIKYIYTDQIDTTDPDNLLERFLNGFVNGVSGRLLTSNYIDFGVYRGLDFYLTSGNEEARGRLLLIGQTPYLLLEDYYAQDYVAADYQKFIDSFSVK